MDIVYPGCLHTCVRARVPWAQGERMEVVVGTNQTDTTDGVYLVSQAVDEDSQPGSGASLCGPRTPCAY